MDARALQSASDVLQREAKRFEQLSEASRTLGEAAAIVNRAEEAEARLAAARADLEDVALAKEEAVRATHLARGEAGRILELAAADAKETQEVAEQKAANLLSEAEATVAAAMVDLSARTQAELAERAQRVAQLELKAEEAVRAADEAGALVLERSAALKDIENRIDAARKAIAAVTGE